MMQTEIQSVLVPTRSIVDSTSSRGIWYGIDNPNAQSFGGDTMEQPLARLRAKRNWTQEQAAGFIGVDVGTYRK